MGPIQGGEHKQHVPSCHIKQVQCYRQEDHVLVVDKVVAALTFFFQEAAKNHSVVQKQQVHLDESLGAQGNTGELTTGVGGGHQRMEYGEGDIADIAGKFTGNLLIFPYQRITASCEV